MFLCCTFIFTSQFLFEFYGFIKMLLGFITGRQEATQLRALLSVHELKCRCMVTDCQ